MENKRIFLSSPHMSEEGYERKFVQEAFDTNWIAPLGTNVDSFEDEICKLTGINNALALNSGSSAIHLALKTVGIRKGDIVLCQSLTFSASANPIIYENATPVFIDSELDTWNLDPKLLEDALRKYPETKALILVHLYGNPSKMEEISSICQKFNTVIIEDAAESLGSLYKGRYTGTLGELGIYSFNGNKIITSSGGGMLVSNDNKKIQKARFWATQSKDPAKYYQHSELGYNYRMSNIIAGIGRGQLRVLEKRIEKKKYIHDYYTENLKKLPGIGFMPLIENTRPNYWLSCITMKGKNNPLEIIDFLEMKNIESRPIWKPMHLQPYFQGYDFIGNGTSQYLFEKGLCLPSDTKMTDADLKKVCNAIKEIWN